MNKERRIEEHTWAGNAPQAWRLCAGDLLAAASVLRERREGIDPDSAPAPDLWRLHPPELMLSGMAIECLLKALWVKRGNELAREGGYVRVPGAGAHLERPCDQVLLDAVVSRLEQLLDEGPASPQQLH